MKKREYALKRQRLTLYLKNIYFRKHKWELALLYAYSKIKHIVYKTKDKRWIASTETKPELNER